MPPYLPGGKSGSGARAEGEITVKAVRYDGFGGIDVLRVEEAERPVPGDGQVLVRVKAAGINPSEAARPTPSSNAATPAARSSSGPDPRLTTGGARWKARSR